MHMFDINDAYLDILCDNTQEFEVYYDESTNSMGARENPFSTSLIEDMIMKRWNEQKLAIAEILFINMR